MKKFQNLNEKDSVTAIKEVTEEEKTPKSDPEDSLSVNEILDQGKSVKKNENIKPSELMYLKKETDTDM